MSLAQPIDEHEREIEMDATLDAGALGAAVWSDFPILARPVHGKRLAYLDNAASTQKPRQVIEAIRRAYEETYANVHRGVHYLSQESTRLYEEAREKIRRFIGAASTREIIFTRGATESINLVASSFGQWKVREGDEIVVTYMEHHSNIVPWQLLCQRTGAKLKVAPVSDGGQLILEEFRKLLTDRTRIVAAVHVSNALGTINPVKAMAEMARAHGAAMLVDGAQSVSHVEVNVRDLDCDFFAFSGHKMYGPTGIGVLYGKEALLNKMPPYQGGGDMIESVSFEKSTWNELPYKFEAGTPNFVDAIGLGAAIDYVRGIGIKRVAAYENGLMAYALRRMGAIDRVRLVGNVPCRIGVLPFVIDGIHPHDIGTFLDKDGVAIRTGHHCAQPVLERLGTPVTARASLGLYNTREDIDALAEGVRHVIKILG